MPVVLLATALSASLAAAPVTEQDRALWGAVTSAGDFDPRVPRLHGWFEQQTRSAENATELRQMIFRSALGVRLVEGLTGWVGFAWIPTYRRGERIDEQRIYQQLLYAHTFASGLSLQSRTRFEQRFVLTGSDLGLRVRNFMRMSVPFTKRAPVLMVVWDEPFFALNRTDWGARAGVNQNRLFMGVGYPFGAMRVEVGYINVYLVRSGPDLVTHIIQTALFHKF